MACHGACGDFLLVLAEEQALPPVRKLQPLAVQNRYSIIVMAQNPNVDGSIRYSGRLTISPVTGRAAPACRNGWHST